MLKLGRADSIRISPDTRFVAATGTNVVLWNLETRKRAAHAHPFKHPGWIDFSPDGRLLAVENTLGDVVILEVPSLEIAAAFPSDQYGEGSGVVFASDGAHLIDGVGVRSIESGEAFFHEERGGIFGCLCSTPDRRTVAYHLGRIGVEGGEVVVRSWPFDEEESVLRHEVSDTVWAMALAPDGGEIAIACALSLEARSVDGWDLRASREIPITGTGYNIAFSPVGESLALAEDGRVLLLDEDLRELEAWPLPYASDVHFSPAGRLLAMGSWDRSLIVELDP